MRERALALNRICGASQSISGGGLSGLVRKILFTLQQGGQPVAESVAQLPIVELFQDLPDDRGKYTVFRHIPGIQGRFSRSEMVAIQSFFLHNSES